MSMSGVSRRALLLATLGAPLMARALVAGDDPAMPGFLSASGDDGEHFGLSLMANEQSVRTTLSGFRGHACASSSRYHVLFARRPQTTTLVVDHQLRHQADLEAERGCYFSGHGCFSAQGAQLLLVEVDNDNGESYVRVVRVGDWATLRRIPTGGIGAHEIHLMPSADALAVAHTGMIYHGREVTNLMSMKPSLSLVSLRDDDVQTHYTLAESAASIRHLDVSDDGTLVVATQLQRQACSHQRPVPLLATLRPGATAMQPCRAPDAVWHALNDYLGSVVIHPDAGMVATTSPRGNLCLFFDLASGELAGHHDMHDVCGVTMVSRPDYFVLTNSLGEMRFIQARSLTEERALRRQYPGIAFDNHLLSL